MNRYYKLQMRLLRKESISQALFGVVEHCCNTKICDKAAKDQPR